MPYLCHLCRRFALRLAFGLVPALLALSATGCRLLDHADRPPQSTFVNPVYEGADPWVVRHTDGFYYFCQSEGDRGIAVWKSDRLTDKGVKRVVWNAPSTGWNTHEVWAPELHFLNGKWYIYYAADSGENKDHRMGVLESVTADPQGAYVDKGMLYTGDDIEGRTGNRWAIDGTPLEMDGRLYFLWSGWQGAADEQWLYIAEMANPWTIASNRVRIADNDDYLWERVAESPSERGLAEGPQVLRRRGKVHVIYSASASWLPTYKLGRLTIDDGADPMDPANWTKHPEPVFQGTPQVHGVGHASFTKSPDGTEDWIVYHSKIDTDPGWRRNVRLQRFFWNTDGTPSFGTPVPAGTPIPLPSGERPNDSGASVTAGLRDGTWDRWVYYGYNRFIGVQDGALSLNAFPEEGMANNYGSGEKALIRGLEWSDLSISARVQIVRGDREAGVLFRAAHPAVGYNAVDGYFAGLNAAADAVVLAKLDGQAYTEIVRAPLEVQEGGWHELAVAAVGDEIVVSVDGRQVLTAEDGAYRSGMAGVRSVDVHALFDDVQVSASP